MNLKVEEKYMYLKVEWLVLFDGKSIPTYKKIKLKIRK